MKREMGQEFFSEQKSFAAETEKQKQEKEHDETLNEIERIYDSPSLLSEINSQKADYLKSHIENLPEYKQYMSQRIRFDTLDSVLNDFNSNIKENEENNESEKLRRGLESLINDVKFDVSSYYKSILKIEHLKNQQFRMDKEEYVEELEERDKNRSNRHNALIADTKAFTRLCSKTIPEQLGFSIPSEKLFNQNELQDREIIGAWAYSTERGERIKRVLDLVNKSAEKGKAEPVS